MNNCISSYNYVKTVCRCILKSLNGRHARKEVKHEADQKNEADAADNACPLIERFIAAHIPLIENIRSFCRLAVVVLIVGLLSTIIGIVKVSIHLIVIV